MELKQDLEARVRHATALEERGDDARAHDGDRDSPPGARVRKGRLPEESVARTGDQVDEADATDFVVDVGRDLLVEGELLRVVGAHACHVGLDRDGEDVALRNGVCEALLVGDGPALRAATCLGVRKCARLIVMDAALRWASMSRMPRARRRR